MVNGNGNGATAWFRPLHPGMGQAVAERTVLRKKGNGTENWGDVAERVALGNSMLVPKDFKDPDHIWAEEESLRHHIANGSLLMSGRHLQHGDASQPTRTMEVFTNCSTAACSFAQFLLLLNGSGVGRCYDDDMMIVDWDNAPNVRCVLSSEHPDFDWSAHEDSRSAKHKYRGKDVMWFVVPDSREGWAKALEIWENSAFEKIHRDKVLVLDFSQVRPRGAPINGMQNRPSSGPVPLMNAFAKALTVKGAGMDPWMQSMYVDHYFAECVLVGGARRAARMATKSYRDKNVVDFVRIKRPIEFAGMTMDEVIAFRKDRAAVGKSAPGSFLWSANNSVTVDAEFWKLIHPSYAPKTPDDRKRAEHAQRVAQYVLECSYGDGTGEPGIINVDMLVQNDEGLEELSKHPLLHSHKYQLEEETEVYAKRILRKAKKKDLHMIVNPCSEIVLNLTGGFCVIADVVPFHASDLQEAADAFRVAARALVRVNLMDSVYKHEVQRTNRIGVGMTGVHEFAWKFFNVGFRDLISVDPAGGFVPKTDSERRALEFWETLAGFSNAAAEEATKYSAELGVSAPHTVTTIKPAGTTSKLFGLTEGWHLPSMGWYMRWVQFREDDPLVKDYQGRGYPIRKLSKTLTGTVIVGFPTRLAISDLDMGDKLVFAGDATPEEQFRWLMLGERYWLEGKTNDPESKGHGKPNQISYTLKYRPDKVDFAEFRSMVLDHQSRVRCCSVMPQEDGEAMAAHEYLPEQPLSKAEYEGVAQQIAQVGDVTEEISLEHVDCASGACPIDFNAGAKLNGNGLAKEH